MRNQEMAEKQAEAERVTGLIQPVQQRIHELTQVVANASLEHPSSDRVQELEQQAEEARREIERLTPIFGQFQQKVGSAEQSAPEDALEDAPKDVQEEKRKMKRTKKNNMKKLYNSNFVI